MLVVEVVEGFGIPDGIYDSLLDHGTIRTPILDDPNALNDAPILTRVLQARI